jgi:hypothetical protein
MTRWLHEHASEIFAQIIAALTVGAILYALRRLPQLGLVFRKCLLLYRKSVAKERASFEEVVRKCDAERRTNDRNKTINQQAPGKGRSG